MIVHDGAHALGLDAEAVLNVGETVSRFCLLGQRPRLCQQGAW
jgi:hypothetical protein